MNQPVSLSWGPIWTHTFLQKSEVSSSTRITSVKPQSQFQTKPLGCRIQGAGGKGGVKIADYICQNRLMYLSKWNKCICQNEKMYFQVWGGEGAESAWEASLYSFKQHQMSSNDHFGVSTQNLKSLCEHTQKGALGKCTNFMIKLLISAM